MYLNNELIIYLFVLLTTFFLFYYLVTKIGFTDQLFKIFLLIYSIYLLFPEIFILHYFVFSNIIEFIKSGDLLSIGCIRDKNDKIICM